MNKRTYLPTLALALAASFLIGTPASAGILYDNGPISDNTFPGAWGISSTNVFANSFTLTSASILTGVNAGLVVRTGGVGGSPVSLDWGISATPDYGSSLGGATGAGLTNTPWCNTCGDKDLHDIYASSFLLPNIVLGPGTYYLSLRNGKASVPGAVLYLNVSSGPSVGYANGLGNVARYSGLPGSKSTSFQILGDAVPEPASTAMFLSGLALVAGLARRKMRA